MLELENLKGKFTDKKIIILAALKAENDILEINKKLEFKKNTTKIISNEQNQNDNKIIELIKLKDQISSLEEENRILKEQNKINIDGINKINKKIVSLIEKILSKNDDRG